VDYTKDKLSNLIKEKALLLGFDAVGIAKAEKLPKYAQRYDDWIKSGYHAKMKYMERNIEKREDPSILVEGAKSIISLVISYYPKKLQSEDIPQIAKYAYGDDYHDIIKNKMRLLWDFIKEIYPKLDGRIFVDSAPIPDREWAVNTGLGWIGKNGCLINKEIGSFTFISELVVNIELQYDKPYTKNYCGSCTKCIDACPTDAIVKDGVIDSNRCISYQTIENRDDEIPKELTGLFKNRLFGCDICQDVCPWNKNPLTSHIEEFNPYPEVLSFDRDAWSSISKSEFNKIFKKSPIKRAKYEGVMRNIKFLEKRRVVLFAPLNWGLGHATRDIPIIKQYISEGYDIVISANGRAKSLLKREFPNLRFINIWEYKVRYAPKFLFIPFLIFQMPIFYFSFLIEHIILKRAIKKYNISTVISDNRYGLWNKNIKSIIITHQLFIKLPKRIKFLEKILHTKTQKLINKFDECWVPDFKDEHISLSGELSHGMIKSYKKIKYINPLSRFDKNIRQYDVDIPDILVLISGPEPYRSYFERDIEKQFKNTVKRVLIICGKPNEFFDDKVYLKNGITKVGHIDTELLKFYIVNAQQIIARSGYSTIMDLYTLGVSAKLIPTPNQQEQEYLAEYNRKK
jgi:epoxyqueuosine reductase